MGRQEYENFKLKVKDWMDNHPEEYDLFEEEMNNKDNSGYQKIFMLACKLAPKYKKVIQKRRNQGVINEDISDIIDVFSDSKIGEILVDEFENTPKHSIVPAMLSWLYYGKCFERMVERGEEMRKDSRVGYIDKFLIANTIKIVVSKSISLGLRTKSDWEEHRKLMKLVDEKNVMEWDEQDIFHEKKNVGRPSNNQTLPEILSATVTHKPEDILNRIENFLLSKNSKRDIACLKIALEELYYIYPCKVTTFRNSLNELYGEKIKIISERGIQDANKELNELIDGKPVKHLKENRDYIEQIKALLSE